MAKKPAVTILPTRRDLKFNLPAERILDWHTSGGSHTTAFLNTFSTILPVGERFFIDAVRSYRDQITDPALKKAVTAFIGQEAMHGREHEAYNEAIFARSKAAVRFEKRVTALLNFSQRRLPKSFRLSTTIALEHFTALLADSVLRSPKMTDGAHPAYRAVWEWHALEETEHKAVAYDVWLAVMGRSPNAYLQRTFGQAAATVIFWGLSVPAFLGVLREQGKLTDVEGWRKFFDFTLGKDGLLRLQLLPYLDYFRPGYHPWDHDNSAYLSKLDAFIAEHERLQAA